MEESKDEIEAEEEKEAAVAGDVQMESYDLDQQAKILEDLNDIFGIKAAPSGRQKKLNRQKARKAKAARLRREQREE